MDDDLFEKLTEKQRECLRAAAEGLQEKEIAIRLETTPAAVKERLRSARQRLGAGSSREAGRRFVAWERAKAYTPEADYYPRHVEVAEKLANPPAGALSGLANDMSAAAIPEGASELFDHSAVYVIDRPTDTPQLWSALFPALDRRPNDLTLRERCTVIGIALIVLLVSGSTAVFAFISLSRFLLELSQKGG